jgi:hypothetical protein
LQVTPHTPLSQAGAPPVGVGHPEQPPQWVGSVRVLKQVPVPQFANPALHVKVQVPLQSGTALAGAEQGLLHLLQ